VLVISILKKIMRTITRTIHTLRLVHNWINWFRKEVFPSLWFSHHEARRRKDLLEIDFCHTYILSYPRSGNHAVRFAVEFLSERPTLGAGDHESFSRPKRKYGLPIFLLTPHINISSPLPRPAAIKRHQLRDFDAVDKLIFIERDVVEAVLSHTGGGTERELMAGVLSWKLLQDKFEQFPEERRLLIRFEDILNGELLWIKRLSDFLELDTSHDKEVSCANLVGEAKEVLRRRPKTNSGRMYANRFPDEAAFIASFAAKIGAVRHS